MSNPRISVVVPFYNNGDVLEDCLRSIAAQTFADLQVIMVDDGSTDDGPATASQWTERDPRFTLVQVPNGGPGKARNIGVQQARGEFLAFVDGDDMLPRHTYEVLLHALESSGSDFVSGAVDRIGTGGVRPSSLHERAIKGRKTATHVTRSPELLYDISVWNKLFRKSFWDARRLHYPEGVVWEDLQLMTRAHVLAQAVDVVPDRIYFWRERAAGEFSITQNRTHIQNLRDRITALRAIDSFLREHAPARTLRHHQRKALVNDIWLYVRDLCRVDEDYLCEYFDMVGEYLQTVARRVHRSVPATHKLAYYLTRRRLRAPLLQFVTWLLEQRVTTIPVVRRFGRLRADLPFRTDRELRIPSWVYRPHWRDLDPFVQVDSVQWQRGNLVIAGQAYVPSVDVSKRRYTNKVVILRPRHRFRPPVVSLATSNRHLRATALSGQDRYDYTWAGFRAEISSRWFRVAGRWLTGDWDCFILVRGHGVWRPSRLHSPGLGGAGRPGFLEPAPGLQVRPTWSGRHLHIGVLRTPARLAAFSRDGDGLAVEADLDLGEVGGAVGENAEFVLVRRGGALTQTFPAGLVSVTERTARVSGTVPLAALPALPERPGPGVTVSGESSRPGETRAREGTSTEWELYLKPVGGGRVRVTFPEALPEARYPRDTREVAVERGRYGAVVLAEREPRPVISEHFWDPHGVLVLRGGYLGPPGARLDVVLRSRESAEEQVLACQRDGEQFSVKVPVAAMPIFGETLPLRDGPWEIAAQVCIGPRQTATPVACDHTRLNEISHRKTQIGPKLYAFTTADYDTPVITAEPRLRLSEQSQFNRRVLRKAVYPIHSRRPLWDAVLFVSWNGKQCTDNPLGVAEELRRRGDDREHIWVVNDYCVAVPPGARAVLTGTEEYFEALARCRYVVSNDDMPVEFRKREGQVYLQTWHGTPLKRVGFDIGLPQFASGSAYLDRLAADVAKWDLLLSQNPFSTPILRRAFRFDGEVVESGYPRNDVLSRGEERCAQVRAKLGIPAGKRVVLYAPTWRDNQYYASGRYRFDLRLDLEQAWEVLGPGHVVLVRGHHHLANDVSASARPGFVCNVTGYPDVAELFLVTDVLVTDYSSVMFDFAVTGRPMVFFAYDLASYRDHLRGFCFDFEAEAPGPVVTTSQETLAAVRDADAVAAEYADAYQAFAAKYCPFDDGKAGARVCDRLFPT